MPKPRAGNVKEGVKRATVFINKSKIAQVLRHLIGNAIKYSPCDGVVQVNTRLCHSAVVGGKIINKKHSSKDCTGTADESNQHYQSVDGDAVDDGGGLIVRIEITDDGPGINKVRMLYMLAYEIAEGEICYGFIPLRFCCRVGNSW